MFDKEILKLANSQGGKWLLWGKENLEGKIVGLFPNGFCLWIDRQKGQDIFVARFYTWDRVASLFLPEIEKIKIASEYQRIDNPYEAFLHFSGLEPKPSKYPHIFLATETFAEQDNVTLRTNQAVWADARNGVSPTSNIFNQHETSLTAGTYRVDHGFMHFNSAALPDNATLTANSSFVRINGSLGGNPDTVTGHVVSSTATSPPTTGDWNNIGSTSFGSYTFAGFATGDNDITLNASGDAQISLTGLSKFGLRTNRDIDNNAPTGTNYINITQANCLLSVTYTLPAGETGFSYLM